MTPALASLAWAICTCGFTLMKQVPSFSQKARTAGVMPWVGSVPQAMTAKRRPITSSRRTVALSSVLTRGWMNMRPTGVSSGGSMPPSRRPTSDSFFSAMSPTRRPSGVSPERSSRPPSTGRASWRSGSSTTPFS